MQELEATLMIDGEGNWIIDRTDGDPVAVWCEVVGNDVPAVLKTYQLRLKVPTPKPVAVLGELPTNDEKPLTLTVS